MTEEYVEVKPLLSKSHRDAAKQEKYTSLNTRQDAVPQKMDKDFMEQSGEVEEESFVTTTTTNYLLIGTSVLIIVLIIFVIYILYKKLDNSVDSKIVEKQKKDIIILQQEREKNLKVIAALTDSPIPISAPVVAPVVAPVPVPVVAPVHVVASVIAPVVESVVVIVPKKTLKKKVSALKITPIEEASSSDEDEVVDVVADSLNKAEAAEDAKLKESESDDLPIVWNGNN